MSGRMQPFQRTDRVSDQVLRVLGEVIQRELKDPRVGFVTLTGVEVARDLASARVFFTAGEEADLEEVSEGLLAAAGYLRRRLGEELTMRLTPELRFIYDESVDRGFRMDALLRDLAEERDDAD